MNPLQVLLSLVTYISLIWKSPSPTVLKTLASSDTVSIQDPEPIQNLDMMGCKGRWYQMYTSMIPNNTYERNGKCITADIAMVDSTPFLDCSITVSAR
jgi:hypothetical protein